VFGGWDLVSDADHLEYAYVDEKGERTAFGKLDSLDLAAIGRITHAGEQPLMVSVRDEAGLIGTYPLDVRPYAGHGSGGRPQMAGSGCACDVGGSSGSGNGGAWLVGLLGLGYLLTRSRAWGRLRRLPFRGALRTLALVGAAGLWLVGCGCDRDNL